MFSQCDCCFCHVRELELMSWGSGLSSQCGAVGSQLRGAGGWSHPTAWHQWATHSQEFPFSLFSVVLTSSIKKKIATFQQIHVDECWCCRVISEESSFINGFFGVFLAEISGLYPLLEVFDERFLTAFLLFIGSVEYTISFWAMGDPQAGRKAASHKPLSSSSCPSELPEVPFLVTISLCIRWRYFFSW